VLGCRAGAPGDLGFPYQRCSSPVDNEACQFRNQRMVTYVTGTVNQELLLRNEYLGAENRILRGQIKGRLLLSEGEKAPLAEIAQRLGRKA
jgi:hypothetical protein